jgi:hypothetical protein
MKLGALGLVTVAIGVALSAVGLVGIGAYWVVMGGIAHTLRPRLTAKGPEGARPHSGNFALGVLVLLAVGVPSLVVGILGLGIDDGDSAWRWLPLVVGVVATGFGAISAILYAAGAGLATATGDTGGSIPATVWIRSVKETGQFINERPRLEFVLRVQPDEGSGIVEYDATKRATVPFTAMAYLRVGDGFRAHVTGPDDPDAMTIDWDSPVSSSA